MRYLKRRTVKGVTYTYFRDRAGKLTALPGAEGSGEFKRAYDVCLRAMLVEKGAPDRPPADAKDTVAKAIEVYLNSTRYAGLALSTKKRQRKDLDLIRECELGRSRLRDFDVYHVNRYAEGTAKKRGTAAAQKLIHIISDVWQTAIDYPEFGIAKLPNPTHAARGVYKVQREHRPWPVELLEQFDATAPLYLVRAKNLLHYSVQRGGDCVKLRWSDYDGEALYVRPEKTHGERKAKAQRKQCVEPLREMLDQMIADGAPSRCDHILVNGDGQAFANAAVLSKAIARHLRRIGHGASTYNMHGLRKTGACDIVLAGGGVAELKSVGWQSDSQALYYVRGLDSNRANRNAADLWNAELKRQLQAKRREQEVAARRSNIRAV
jgi:integrase